MDPVDFLDIAARFWPSASEAERRTAIGRSYYALYNLVLDSLSSHDIKFQRAGRDHELLVYYLTTCPDPNAAKIGAALRDLRVQRNLADYDMSVGIAKSESELAYEKAKRAVGRFKELTNLTGIVHLIKSLPPPKRRRP